MASSVLPLRPLQAAAPDPGVVALDGSGHPTSTVGGKAASLDALVKEGFAVPPAAAVTTGAYSDFVRGDVERVLARLRPKLIGEETDEAFRNDDA